VRADALINSSIVNWVWRVGVEVIGGGEIGVDGGELTLPIPIPNGQSVLGIAVRIPPSSGTATALYNININKPPACGDHVCNFRAATGSVITIFGDILGPFVVPLPATGSANILCGTNTPDTSGKCACSAEIVSIDPLDVPDVGTVCLVPEPAGTCPQGDIDCDGGNDQDVDLVTDHNIGTCSGGHAGCLADCTTYCAGLGVVPATFGCEGFCQLSNDPCTTGNTLPPPDGCVPGDTCVGGTGGFVRHAGVCNCQCLTLGNGAPGGADPGDALLNVGFALNILVAGDEGDDGQPCTDDDTPSIILPSQCVPFTTATASTVILNANNVSMAMMPPGGVAVTGPPFTCGGGVPTVPTTASGAGLQAVVAFLDSTILDLAVTVEINCE